MEPWYKVVQPRPEVSAGRSFNPDEFAIALEQVVSGKAPEDYTNPINFFARTCFTRALHEHIGMVLRRLNGETANAAPVLTLITQFGGGKTHTLAALYHLVNNAKSLPSAVQSDLLRVLEAIGSMTSGSALVPQSQAFPLDDQRRNGLLGGHLRFSQEVRRSDPGPARVSSPGAELAG